MDAQTQQKITTLNTRLGQHQNRLTGLDKSLAALRAERAATEEDLYLHNSLVHDFELDREQSIQSVDQLRQFSDIRLAQGYAESFSSLLTGPISSRASYALDSIGASLRNELDRLDDEIRKKEAEIDSLHGQLNLLRGQINALQ
jgi:predicted  nucleic acid-binding Zn-ribbon protein